MTDDSSTIHELDVSLWVGKDGVETGVIEELADQLDRRDRIKVRFLRSALADGTVETLAERLADGVEGRVIDCRGHTAVIEK